MEAKKRRVEPFAAFASFVFNSSAEIGMLLRTMS